VAWLIVNATEDDEESEEIYEKGDLVEARAHRPSDELDIGMVHRKIAAELSNSIWSDPIMTRSGPQHS
jgi:hypothetical protein